MIPKPLVKAGGTALLPKYLTVGLLPDAEGKIGLESQVLGLKKNLVHGCVMR